MSDGSRTCGVPSNICDTWQMAAPPTVPRTGCVERGSNVGEKVITVEFRLGGFAGPLSLRNFDSAGFVADLLSSARGQYAVIGDPIVIGERFEGENTERFQVQPYAGVSSGDLCVMDTDKKYTVFEARHLSREAHEDVAALLNEKHGGWGE